MLLHSTLKLLQSVLKTYLESVNYENLLAFYQESGLLDELFHENMFYIPGKT
jgi:hypothetical protein